MLREHMEHKESREFGRVYLVNRRDENSLLGKTVDHDEEGGVARGSWEVFNEVHGDGVPRFLGYRELFQETIRPMARGFASFTGCTGSNEVLAERPEVRPHVISSNKC